MAITWADLHVEVQKYYIKIFHGRQPGFVSFPDDDDSKNPEAGDATKVLRMKDANVIMSEIKNDPVFHRPVLDIDYGVEVVPSSTPGHFHLYLNKTVRWSEYKNVLRALADAGLIEEGYANASIKRGYSAVRLPWIKKKENK